MSNSGLLIHARKGPAAEAGPISKWLASLVLIATGYFLAGRLGQLLAVPPSYATAIWPASGIALAGVLLLGYRVWPGIFLGALLVNGWTPLSDADGIRAAVGALLVPGSISAGATIQALLGASPRWRQSVRSRGHPNWRSTGGPGGSEMSLVSLSLRH